MTSAVSGNSLSTHLESINGEEHFKGQRVIIYTPITGNPPHLGHLNIAADAAITALKAGAVACRVFISLAPQDYLKGKQTPDNLKLNEKQREQLLRLTIEDSQSLFPPNVMPEYCGFEGQGYHIQKYREIQTTHKDSKVFLAAGADLQHRMNDWKTQKNFSAFVQHRGSDKGIEGTNRVVLQESKAFTNISSSDILKAILTGEQPEGIGPLAADYLKKLVPLPFRFQELERRFSSYNHLLNAIARRFPTLECSTKKMSVTAHPDHQEIEIPVAVLEQTLEPTFESLRQVFHLANKISINRPYPDQKYDQHFEVNGVIYTCHRPNHNGTHSYRQVRYLEVLLDLIAKCGRKEAKDFCQNLTEEEIVNLKLATFFLRAGRLDESGPESPDQKRLRSFELYKHYAISLGILPECIEETQPLILDSCTPNSRLDYKDKLSWNSKAFLQTLLTLAHEIDLVRCFPNFETRTKPNLVENLSYWVLDEKTDAESVATQLQNYGIEANRLVGQEVQLCRMPYDLPRFYVHSTFGHYCHYRLEKLDFSMGKISHLFPAAGPAKSQLTSDSTPNKGICAIM